MASDLLRWPVLSRVLRWRHSRSLLQLPILTVSIVMVLHGFFGPSLSPKNLATSLTWVYFRGLLIFVLLIGGNFFCMGCPFVLVRDFARKLHAPRLNWPRPLRNKWLPFGLLAAILFAYEAFSLWASPWWTASLIVAYFAAILAIDLTFKHAAFCKFICLIGQFNFLAAALSPFEVQVREQKICGSCATKDCIRGTRSPQSELVTVQRGCELALFLPSKVGNMDCTFCLDCVHACPHDNIGILARVPGEEMQIDPQRSGVGHLLRRPDVSSLICFLTFAALMNAFGMVSPAYAFERWLSGALHLGNQTAILAIVFTLFTVLAPAVLLGAASFISSRWTNRTVWQTAIRYTYSLAPLGFAMWLAHYGFHLLTGLFTIVPVTQNAAVTTFGFALLGGPQWTLTGLPVRLVEPVEYGFLMLGLAGSLSLLSHYAHEDSRQRWPRVFLSWSPVMLLIFIAGAWLVAQPMDMRATFLQ